MKANRKFVNDEEAVSAVIGVILMVAITVAIAATVYVYVSGILGTSPDVTPSIQFQKDNADKTLQVSQADPLNLDWSKVNITVILPADVKYQGNWYKNINASWKPLIGYGAGDTAPTGWLEVTAGNKITFHSATTEVTMT